MAPILTVEVVLEGMAISRRIMCVVAGSKVEEGLGLWASAIARKEGPELNASLHERALRSPIGDGSKRPRPRNKTPARKMATWQMC